MKVGTEDKKKVGLLAGLSVVALITVYTQFFTGPQMPESADRPAAAQSAQRPSRQAGPGRAAAVRRSRSRQLRNQEFQPIWRRSHDDEEFDPLETDPTLQLELLAAVRKVGFEGVERNIFRFAEKKVEIAPPPQVQVDDAQRRQEAFERAQAQRPEPAPQPQRPRAPRLTWKYYGFASESGDPSRRAFLLDGEDVLIAAEGETLKNRYEVTDIGLTSITIKDRQFDEEQSLPITVPQG